VPLNDRDLEREITRIIRHWKAEVGAQLLRFPSGELVVSLEPFDNTEVDWVLIRRVAAEVEVLPEVSSVVLSVGHVD
jgi:hypothetical protein